MEKKEAGDLVSGDNSSSRLSSHGGWRQFRQLRLAMVAGRQLSTLRLNGGVALGSMSSGWQHGIGISSGKIMAWRQWKKARQAEKERRQAGWQATNK